MANENTSDDTISLEDLVQKDGGPSASIAGAPVPTPESATPDKEPETPPAGAPAAVADDGMDVAKIDDLLAVEDPAFAASLEELKAANDMDGEEGVEIDPIDIDTIIAEPAPLEEGQTGEPPTGWKGKLFDLLHRAKNTLIYLATDGLKAALQKLKSGIHSAIEAVKNGVIAFKALSWSHKLMALSVVVLAVALFLVLRITFKGDYLPDMQEHFLNGFEEIADEVYEYDPRAPMEDFQNPLLHPENVVLLDKLVVNLKQPGDGSNPMGMFEFYIETASREAAIELKDREVEAKDVVSRTLEQMPYDELVTESGKHKLKVVMRKDLNDFLTKGRVRKIFFKTIVLKP